MASIVLTGARGQTIVGTWQQVDQRTCLDSEFPQSDTEKELLQKMGSTSQTGVAKLIRFDNKGRGSEGIFSAGKRKGTGMSEFQYQLNDTELQFLDQRSGMITQRFIIDTLTDTSLKVHDALKDCETRSFTRVK